ncbi:MAG TPA: prenyltransferase/squalene oxidase repeat-containing protein [Natronosporangium sp.]
MTTDPMGSVGPSIYDTARLVALAPWLAGHQARVAFLCRHQRGDGGWGGPDGYAVIPTLSATTALLTELTRSPDRAGPPGPDLARAAARGLRALCQWLTPPYPTEIPDTIGVEVILPALIDELSALVAGPAGELLASRTPEPESQPQQAVEAVRLPPEFDHRSLARVRAAFAAQALPRRAWACLEVVGPAAAGAPFIHPAMGAVGCSAAATAAWLGGAGGDPAAVEFLDTLQARAGGPVPGVSPITYFEPAWVLNSFAVGGLAPTIPTGLLDRLERGLTDEGAPAAPGLPADSDDTAAVLSALLLHGRIRSADSLLGYRTDEYFRCFVDERNPSVSANAHVLETLAHYLARQPALRTRYAAPAAMAASWLLDQQDKDGSWWDKWHASPYYATTCCVLALLRYDPAGTRPAVERAVKWVRQTQRPDGSWGRWQGTIEETAYAVQLLAVAAPGDPAAAAAIAGGRAYLQRPAGDPAPLWHAKDLYAPLAVIEAARLAALQLAGSRWSAPPRAPGSAPRLEGE